MMRALYSAVSGLKVHQTKMDVIGNNIANVNTIGFKSSSVNFADTFYQTTQHASGANALTGKAGTNAKQIGLGSTVAAISTAITGRGGTQRTDNATDIMINGDEFFIVNSGGNNYFTKNGAFTTDVNGNLCTEAGELVMGWKVDDATGNISKGQVSPLGIYTADNTYSAPSATTDCYFSGNIDQTDTDFETGKTIQMEFYDSLGNKYTAKYTLTQQDTTDKNQYTVQLADILDNDGLSIYVKSHEQNGMTVYEAKVPEPKISFGGAEYTASVDTTNGKVSLTGTGLTLTFNASTGKFVSINGDDAATLSIDTGMTGATSSQNLFSDIRVDFSKITMYESSGNSKVTSTRGNVDTNLGAGSTLGKISGVSISDDGKIYASYDNGNTKLLGQIAVASFANPAGLESVGGSLFKETLNSGEFDGVGVDISENGDSFSTGVLEMSNVDLSSEFTDMITTQRGFQANSRIITTSDTLLEELINLKR